MRSFLPFNGLINYKTIKLAMRGRPTAAATNSSVERYDTCVAIYGAKSDGHRRAVLGSGRHALVISINKYALPLAGPVYFDRNILPAM